MEIVALHPIKAAKDEEPLVVQDDGLMESSRGQGHVKRDAPSPRLQLEVVFMNVVESLEGEVDPSEDIHRSLSGTCCMTIASLYVSMNLSWLQPYA